MIIGLGYKGIKMFYKNSFVWWGIFEKYFEFWFKIVFLIGKLMVNFLYENICVW